MANSRKLKSDLVDRVADTISPVVPIGSSLLVGLSGGVDSVALLHILACISPQFGWKLSALHVNHGISPHADDWAKFCSGLCDRLAIPLKIQKVDISPLRDMGIEAAARKLRHEALAAQVADFIVLAHHRDDQVETMLLQMLRGAGVRGASAMPLLKIRGDAPPLLRPLLEMERSELETYVKEQGLDWVEDDSNADVSYPRNYLRHEVLPVLEKRFPAYRSTLSRSAGHFAEAESLLDEMAELDAGTAISDGKLNLASLRGVSLMRGKNLLRHFFRQQADLLPGSEKLDELLRQLIVARKDAQIELSWGNRQVRSFRDHLYIFHVLDKPEEYQLCWNGQSDIKLPGSHGTLHFNQVQGAGLSLAKIDGNLNVVSFRPGESIRLGSRRPKQEVRKLLQQSGFPPWLRERLPFIYSRDVLACLPEIGYESILAADDKETGVVISWTPPV